MPIVSALTRHFQAMKLKRLIPNSAESFFGDSSYCTEGIRRTKKRR